MGVILYLVAVLALLMALQTMVLLAYREPLQATFGAHSRHPRAVKQALKIVLHLCIIGSLLVFPRLQGTTVAAYYGPQLALGRVADLLYGELVGLAILGALFAVEWRAAWIEWAPRWDRSKRAAKSALSAVSSLTVSFFEELFFRGIVLHSLLASLAPAPAIGLSAALFAAAHFIKRRRSYWPFVGLAALGIWLGVARVMTGTLWLGMGLHAGGILAIGIHRCYFRYRGPEALIGTQTFPIAGLLGASAALAGAAATWLLLR